MQRHKQDHVGIWFEQRRKLGVKDNILMARYSAETQQTVQKKYQHGHMDGIGCLIHFFESFRLNYNNIPLSRDKNEPNRQQFKKIKKNSRPYLKSIQWRYFGVGKPSAEENIYSALFTREQTHAIKKKADANGVSLNILLFWALNKACANSLIKQGQHYSWFYPVNMRGVIDYKTKYSNYSSGFYLTLDADISLAELRKIISQNLKTGQYWLSWKEAKIAKYLPGFILRLLYRYISQHQFYAGSFSSLGEWTTSGARKEKNNISSPNNDNWYACAPGSANYPISNGALVCNSKLSCTLKLHPTITKSPHQCEAVLKQWVSYLLTSTQDTKGALPSEVKIIHSTLK